MLNIVDEKQKRTKCRQCPLLKMKLFRDFSGDELGFIENFKTGELNAGKGSTILVEGSHSAHLFTVLTGWGFRYKLLEDGRRQILNYILPGDLIGLQGSITGEMEHSIEALTDLTLCVFERDRVMELFRKFPELGYDLTWIAAREECILDEHLLSVGRRTAIEKTAYLLSFLHFRASALMAQDTPRFSLPITQQHVADTLGLSIVHTNKTIRKLVDRKLVKWLDRGCTVTNPDELVELAGWEPETTKTRPIL